MGGDIGESDRKSALSLEPSRTETVFRLRRMSERKTAEEVWNLCNEKLKTPEMSVRNLIRQSGVTLLCTTDDPADSLSGTK